MRYLMNLIMVFVLAGLLTGCARTKEIAKTIWGSSTRALEEARQTGVSATFRCSYDECFDQVIELTKRDRALLDEGPLNDPLKQEQESDEDEVAVVKRPPKLLDLFLKDRVKKHIVVMGVPGSIDTTEVGIFFEDIADKKVRVEISSLSSNAKARAADIVFKELREHYGEVQ